MRLGGKFVPITSLIFPFAFGIILCENNSAINNSLLQVIAVGMFMLVLFLFYKRQTTLLKPSFFIALILLGYSRTKSHNTDFQRAMELDLALKEVCVELDKRVKETNKYSSFVAQVLPVRSVEQAGGKILVHLPKASSPFYYSGDKLLLTDCSKIDLPCNLNPYEFNYGDYLRKKGIHHEVYAKVNNVFVIGSGEGVFTQIDNYRQKVARMFDEQLSEGAAGYAKALTLGQKGSFVEESKRAFIDNGVMHVLSVSGLHVGIVFFMLNALFVAVSKRLFWKVVRFAVVLGGIWLYVALSGFGVSVMRSGLMFTIMQIGLLIGRKGNVLNSLFLSAFILLLFNPLQLFQIGFQFSYLAVLGIVWFYPLLNGCIKSRFWFISKLWSLVAIAIAAQVFVGVLSIYYFHSFSFLFLVSNVIVVPLTSVQLVLGFLILVFQNLHLMQVVLLPLFEGLFNLELSVLTLLSQFDFAIVHDLYIGTTQLLGLILLGVFGIQAVAFKRFAYALGFSLTLLCLVVVRWNAMKETAHQDEVVVFSSNEFCVAHLEGNLATVYSLNTLSEWTLKNRIMPYLKHKGIQSVEKRVGGKEGGLGDFNLGLFAIKNIVFCDKEIKMENGHGSFKRVHLASSCQDLEAFQARKDNLDIIQVPVKLDCEGGALTCRGFRVMACSP